MNTISIIAEKNDNEFSLLIVPHEDNPFLSKKIKLNAGMFMAISQAIEKVVEGSAKQIILQNIGI